jgi:hypothetical protein
VLASIATSAAASPKEAAGGETKGAGGESLPPGCPSVRWREPGFGSAVGLFVSLECLQQPGPWPRLVLIGFIPFALCRATRHDQAGR